MKSNNLLQEFAVFEATHQRTSNSEALLSMLKSLQPTSVESDRAFSACGYFVLKLRTQLSDKTIDAL